MVTCVSCNWQKPEGYAEAVVIGSDTFYVCEPCADNLAGPGKHEAVDEDDRALCVVLESIAADGCMDHWLTDDYHGYVGIVDRFMLLEDERGFVDVRTFASPDAAMREVNSYEDDGFGSDDSDAYISSEYNGWSVSFDGKHEGTYRSMNRAKAKVSLLMRDSGYYPNCFITGEHGPTIRRTDDIRYLAPLTLTDKEN